MTAPEYVAQAAELLAKHGACRWITGDRMTCGMPIPDPHGVRVFTVSHQAEVLAAAGLLPTSTEWGVRHPNLGPETRAIDPDLLDGYGDHWTILTRAVTDWKDAT